MQAAGTSSMIFENDGGFTVEDDYEDDDVILLQAEEASMLPERNPDGLCYF